MTFAGSQHVDPPPEVRGAGGSRQFPVRQGHVRDGPVLLPLAGGETLRPLVDIAAGIAHERRTSLLVMNIVEMPRPTSPRFIEEFLKIERDLDQAVTEVAKSVDIRVSKSIRIGRRTEQLILDVIEECGCDVTIITRTSDKTVRAYSVTSSSVES